jgi:hypothetical protein
MEGISRLPGMRAAEYARAHPGVSIPPPVEGIWRAWIAGAADGVSGRVMCARTEDDLIDRLDRLDAAGG